METYSSKHTANVRAGYSWGKHLAYLSATNFRAENFLRTKTQSEKKMSLLDHPQQERPFGEEQLGMNGILSASRRLENRSCCRLGKSSSLPRGVRKPPKRTASNINNEETTVRKRGRETIGTHVKDKFGKLRHECSPRVNAAPSYHPVSSRLEVMWTTILSITII